MALRTRVLDDAIRTLGAHVKVEHVDFADTQKVESLVQEHDVVLDLANSRSPELAAAVVEGAARYKKTNDRRQLLLHLSGAGNFSDNSHSGTFIAADPFDDSNPEHVRGINASMKPNGAADKIILNAAANGVVNAYIVCPVGIYGRSETHIALKSYSKEAQQYAQALGVWSQWMLDNIKSHGFSPYIGPGTSVFPVVHVDDVVALTMKVLHKAIEIGGSYNPEDVYSHFYLAHADTLQAKTIATIFADVAHRQGLIPQAEVKTLDYDTEVGDGEAAVAKAAAYRYLAGNVILRSRNAAKLGWRPEGPTLQEAMRTI